MKRPRLLKPSVIAFAARVPLAATLASLVLGCSDDAWDYEPDTVIRYKTTEQANLHLHVFEPGRSKSTPPRAAIVFFSGGGWETMNAFQFFPFARHLATRGMVAITAEYRVRRLHGTDPATCVMDAKSAMRWIRRHSDELGIDPERIAAGGGSSGGHLAAMTALAEGFDDPDDETSISAKPNALVLFNPEADTSPEGNGYERVAPYWREISPLHNLRRGTPPTLFMQGTLDEDVPVPTAESYCATMQQNGDRCDLRLYEGQRHGFFNYRHGRNQYYYKTLEETDRFLTSIGFIAPAKAL